MRTDYIDEFVERADPEVRLFDGGQLLQLLGHPDVPPLFLQRRAEVLRVVDDLLHAVPVLLRRELRHQLREQTDQRLELLVPDLVVRFSPLGQRLEEQPRRLARLRVRQLPLQHLARLLPVRKPFLSEDRVPVDRQQRVVQLLGEPGLPARCPPHRCRRC